MTNNNHKSQKLFGFYNSVGFKSTRFASGTRKARNKIKRSGNDVFPDVQSAQRLSSRFIGFEIDRTYPTERAKKNRESRESHSLIRLGTIQKKLKVSKKRKRGVGWVCKTFKTQLIKEVTSLVRFGWDAVH